MYRNHTVYNHQIISCYITGCLRAATIVYIKVHTHIYMYIYIYKYIYLFRLYIAELHTSLFFGAKSAKSYFLIDVTNRGGYQPSLKSSKNSQRFVVILDQKFSGEFYRQEHDFHSTWTRAKPGQVWHKTLFSQVSQASKEQSLTDISTKQRPSGPTKRS